MEDLITFCKDRTTEALSRFLNVLSFVPADKLNWRPTPTAKSALEIAAHCAGYSGAFASIINTRQFPASVGEFLDPINSAIATITSVDQAETMLRKGIADTIAALDTVQPEQIDAIIDTPNGQTPFTFFLTVSALHLETHRAQLDYLQTCWGDLEVHL